MSQQRNEISRVPVIGFVRYSQSIIFGTGKNARDVFEEEYFEYRFKIFKNVTLKSFQQQTDNNFALLVLHSINMPPHYKMRFLELEKTNLFLYNIFVEDTAESFNDAIKKSIDYVSFQSEAAITFRIDNDDAVQHDFIQKLRSFTKKDFVGYSINVPNVTILKRIANHSYMVEERYYHSNSIGLAYVTGKDPYKTILQVAEHDKINDENPLILLPKNKVSVLMTINGENAINYINPANAKILKKEEFDKYLKERKFESLDLHCLRVFDEINNSSNFSLKKIIGLFVPPVINLALLKIKKLFFS
ncbi:glycosyltransferase [Chryseobacterium sp. MDT2-18]|uniref:glycosyltransferase n=1 Tax=Chryseobacterium sp. MDT2-18 TaxID=1259136 RepID=UPI00277EF1E0|nr:glycosyltransferase [Chryseobacterium sp. MDT2-18]MDQ0478177.1 hypothetical protein [Chryseobacterium sp. MDT2-18]